MNTEINDHINPHVKGLQFGTLLIEEVKKFRAAHPEKDFSNYPIIQHANNWIKVRSTAVCHCIELWCEGPYKGKVRCADAEHGDEMAPPNNVIDVADPELLDRLQEWFKYIWGVYEPSK